jgi:hypothetical protein
LSAEVICVRAVIADAGVSITALSGVSVVGFADSGITDAIRFVVVGAASTDEDATGACAVVAGASRATALGTISGAVRSAGAKGANAV